MAGRIVRRICETDRTGSCTMDMFLSPKVREVLLNKYHTTETGMMLKLVDKLAL